MRLDLKSKVVMRGVLLADAMRVQFVRGTTYVIPFFCFFNLFFSVYQKKSRVVNIIWGFGWEMTQVSHNLIYSSNLTFEYNNFKSCAMEFCCHPINVIQFEEISFYTYKEKYNDLDKKIKWWKWQISQINSFLKLQPVLFKYIFFNLIFLISNKLIYAVIC